MLPGMLTWGYILHRVRHEIKLPGTDNNPTLGKDVPRPLIIGSCSPRRCRISYSYRRYVSLFNFSLFTMTSDTMRKRQLFTANRRFFNLLAPSGVVVPDEICYLDRSIRGRGPRVIRLSNPRLKILSLRYREEPRNGVS